MRVDDDLIIEHLATKLSPNAAAPPAPPSSDEGKDAYIVRFDDKDMEDVTFAGYGAEVALKYFEQKQAGGWNCHLFKRIAGPNLQEGQAALPSSDRTEEVIALRAALRDMADAYVRKIKTNLTADEIVKEPWRCAEYIEAERLCRTPFKLLFTKEWLIEKIKNDPDLPCEAGAPAPQ